MPTIRRPSPAEQRAAREARRLRAAELFAQGKTQAEVARDLGVSRQSAHVWHDRYTQGGVEALRSRGPTGPDPKLSDAQLNHIQQALLKGAIANGFDTDLWTLERVAVVITQLTGVRHHPGHVWKLLRQRLGWTLQRPEGRASSGTSRPSPAGWPMSGPGSKRGPRELSLDRLFRRIGRLADPAGASHLVTARADPDPAAPVWLEEGLDGRRAWLPARWHHGAAVLSPAKDGYNTERLIGVLEQLAGFYAGQRVVLLWDGLRAHWSIRMQAWVDSQRDWLVAERLPAYAPELNPVEYLWANLKDVELANLPSAGLVEAADQAQRGIQRVCASDTLVAGFLAHSGLALDDEPST